MIFLISNFLVRNHINMKEDLKILTIQKIAVLLEIIYLLLKIDLEKMEDMELIPQKEKVFL